jgi:hypothetical protein
LLTKLHLSETTTPSFATDSQALPQSWISSNIRMVGVKGMRSLLTNVKT